jgi:hypothetical protein
MTTDIDPDDILVTIDHPHGELEVPLRDWVRDGPGARPFLQLKSARRLSTGEDIPLSEIDDPWRRDPPTYPGPGWRDQPHE